MSGSVLRLLDANANRAREAMRVIEDYARFVLGDPALSAALKSLRHDFTSTARPFTSEAILHRDTPGDVGTVNKTESEATRENVSHVVTASGKRLGEALRGIEEYLKTIDAIAAARIESLRYKFYDIEKQLAFTLGSSAAQRFATVQLYVLITGHACRRDWLETAKLAIDGGADCLQLREKGLESGEFLVRANRLVELCRTRDVISIINDRPDIAILSGADGVHVGQNDLPLREVRKLVGRGKLIGVSTHSIADAKRAVIDGADYVGVGPVFRSATKPREILPGLDFAQAVAEQIKIPAVAIAGIDAGNVDEVLKTGLRAIAVTSAVTGADDPREAARELKAAVARTARP